MDFIFLDGAQGLLIIFPIFFFGHILLTLLIEGFILYKFSFGTFKKSFIGALAANFFSLVIGLFVIGMLPFHFTDGLLLTVGILFLETLLIEYLVLRRHNKSFDQKELLKAVLLMNVISYIPIFIILKSLFG